MRIHSAVLELFHAYRWTDGSTMYICIIYAAQGLWILKGNMDELQTGKSEHRQSEVTVHELL